MLDGAIGLPHLLRIRVLIDIRKPFCTGFRNKKEKGGSTWVSLKYEKLPDLCFACGRVGHYSRNCDQFTEAQIVPESTKLKSKFGP